MDKEKLIKKEIQKGVMLYVGSRSWRICLLQVKY